MEFMFKAFPHSMAMHWISSRIPTSFTNHREGEHTPAPFLLEELDHDIQNTKEKKEKKEKESWRTLTMNTELTTQWLRPTIRPKDNRILYAGQWACGPLHSLIPTFHILLVVRVQCNMWAKTEDQVVPWMPRRVQCGKTSSGSNMIWTWTSYLGSLVL